MSIKSKARQKQRKPVREKPMLAKVAFEISASGKSRHRVEVEVWLTAEDIALLDRVCNLAGPQREAFNARHILGDVAYERGCWLIRNFKEEAKAMAGVGENDCCYWKMLSVSTAKAA